MEAFAKDPLSLELRYYLHELALLNKTHQGPVKLIKVFFMSKAMKKLIKLKQQKRLQRIMQHERQHQQERDKAAEIRSKSKEKRNTKNKNNVICFRSKLDKMSCHKARIKSKQVELKEYIHTMEKTQTIRARIKHNKERSRDLWAGIAA